MKGLELAPFLAEIVGTFVFISVILAEGTALSIGIALTAVIFFIGKISGSHVNPVISLTMWMKKDLSTQKLLGYVMSQVLGGFLALLWWQNTLGAK